MFTNVKLITKYHIKSNIKWIIRQSLEKIVDNDFINFILNESKIINKKINNTKIKIRNYQKHPITAPLYLSIFGQSDSTAANHWP